MKEAGKFLLENWWIPVGIIGGVLGGLVIPGIIDPRGTNATVETIQNSINHILAIGVLEFFSFIIKTSLIIFVH